MDRLIGVEEEFLLADESGEFLRPADDALARAMRRSAYTTPGEVQREFKREQAETSTQPCSTLSELADQIRQMRATLDGEVRAEHIRIAALGTSPVPVRSSVTPGERYETMMAAFGPIASEQLSCGTHVHVSIADRAEGVRVIDAIRPWLPVLTALSANSPFWAAGDTGYASFRTLAWTRWPSAGPTQTFGNAETYDRAVASLVKSGALLDRGMVYFDARLSAAHPTVEIRVADVCQRADDTVVIAALCRALVESAAAAEVSAGDVRVELLRVAAWQAARHGMREDLVDVTAAAPVPAWDLVARLVDHVRAALLRYGDDEVVLTGLDRIRDRGTGADLQRAALQNRGQRGDVVREAMARTVGDVD